MAITEVHDDVIRTSRSSERISIVMTRVLRRCPQLSSSVP